MSCKRCLAEPYAPCAVCSVLQETGEWLAKQTGLNLAWNYVGSVAVFYIGESVPVWMMEFGDMVEREHLTPKDIIKRLDKDLVVFAAIPISSNTVLTSYGNVLSDVDRLELSRRLAFSATHAYSIELARRDYALRIERDKSLVERYRRNRRRARRAAKKNTRRSR